jgi:subtilisin family serine protease
MKRPYRRAGRGEHIDLAAPGVQVWTAASVSGARPKTGTSFAAPFVTAAAALMKSANGNATAADIQDALGKSAEDLGAPGKDDVFGWGLLNASAACLVTSKKAT